MNVPALPLPLSKTAHPAEQAVVARVIAEAAASRTPVYPIGGGVGLRSHGQQSRLSAAS